MSKQNIREKIEKRLKEDKMEKEIKPVNPFLPSWHRDSPIYQDLIEEEKCICNEGFHNGKRIDCACKLHHSSPPPIQFIEQLF